MFGHRAAKVVDTCDRSALSMDSKFGIRKRFTAWPLPADTGKSSFHWCFRR